MADVVFEPDFTAFLAELDKVTKKQTALKNLTMSFGKEGARAYSNLETAAKRAGAGQSEFVTATKANTAAMGNLRAQIIDVGVSLQGGMSPLTVLSQQGPQAAEAMLGLGAAMGPVAAGMAAAAVTVGPLALGLFNAYQNAKDADEASRDYYVALGDLKRGLAGVKDELDELAVREGVLSGALTLTDAEFLRAQKDAKAVFASQTDTINTQLQTLQDRLAALNAIKTNSQSGIGGFAKTLLGGYTAESLSDETATVTKRIADLKGELASITTKEVTYADRLADVTTGEREAGEAAKDRARNSKAAAKDEAEELRRLADLQALRLRLLLDEADAQIARDKAFVAGSEGLDALIAKSIEAQATEEEAIRLKAQAAREQAVLFAREAQEAAITADERKAIAIKLREALNEIGQGEVLDLAANERKKTKLTEDANAQRIAAVESLASSTETLFDAIMESNRTAAENGSESAQKAMLRQFEASRAAGIVEAVINTAVAISAANTIPAPFNIAAIAAAAATGAAQVTTIASQEPPSFSDLPPTRMGGQNGRTATFAENDTVHAYRDPLVGLHQVVQDAISRSMPAPPVARRGRVGPQIATTAVSRLLTQDVERVTRGRIFP